MATEQSKQLDTYIALIRNYLADYPENNYLQPDKEEFTDGLISQGIAMALDIFNSCVGHLTNYTIDNFPVPTLLVFGGAGYTLYSGGVLQARNHFSVSDGSTSGPISEKTELYKAWGQELITNFMTLSTKFKESVNMEQGYAKFASSYLLTHYNVAARRLL